MFYIKNKIYAFYYAYILRNITSHKETFTSSAGDRIHRKIKKLIVQKKT